MPNHVEQDLVVTGDAESLKAFMEFAKEDEDLLSANKFIPYPEKFRLMDELAEIEHKKGNYNVTDGFNSGGYEWCRDNWGTKWGIYNSVLLKEKINKNKGRVKYTFKSAWSPAKLIINAMSKKFSTLQFDLKYFERGMSFKGQYIVKDGLALTDVQFPYHGRRGG